MKISKILLLLIPTILSSCSYFKTKNQQQIDEKIISTNNMEYYQISNLKISWNSVFSLAKPKYFVYFYSLTCSHCNQLKNSIINYGLNNENFYFCEADERHIIKPNAQFTIGSSSIENFWIAGYPSLCQISENVCMQNIVGVSNILLTLNL